LGDALNRARLPLVSGSASVRPLDSLTCPALVLELAPASDSPASIADAAYQQRVAEAVAGALVLWKDKVQPPPHAAAAAVKTAHAEANP
jgi:N-acetylmuramoyl-L-alanine amidase